MCLYLYLNLYLHLYLFIVCHHPYGKSEEELKTLLMKVKEQSEKLA